MESTIVRKGKDCVALVNTALAQIRAGNLGDASLQLDTMKEDVSELAAQAEALATRLEKVEEHYRQQGEDLQRKIGEYGCKEEDLRRQKSSVESSLTGQQSVLQSNQTQLTDARNALSNAQRKRREKEEEKVIILSTSIAGGVALGILTFGIGAAVGAVTTTAAVATLTTLIIVLKEEEKEAARKVERCESDCSSANASISASQQEISSFQSSISRLSAEIEQMKRQRLKYNKDAGELKEVIAFLRESVQFWRMFKQVTDHGVNRTEVLQRIVDKTREKADLQILQKGASQRIAATFLEAWESMEATAVEGGTKYMPLIDFKCSHCSGTHTALPYVKDESFICVDCHSRLAIA